MKKVYRICYYPMAIEDLKSIFLYIETELCNRSAAERIVNSIRSAVRGLQLLPERHQVVNWEPWRSMKIHQIPVNSYIVFYEIEHETHSINIIRIVYGGVDLSKLDKD